MSNKISLVELRFNPIRKSYDNGVEIYNLTPEMKTELFKLIEQNIKDNEINIDGKNVLLQVLPMLTNIYLPSDDEIIKEIIDNPSELLEEVIDEVTDILTKYMDKIMKNINRINKMTNEQKEQFFKALNIDKEEKIELTPEEEEKFKKWQTLQNG